MLNHYEYFPSTEVLLIVALSDVVVFVGLQLSSFSILQLDWIGRAQLARHNVQVSENQLKIRVKRNRENRLLIVAFLLVHPIVAVIHDPVTIDRDD